MRITDKDINDTVVSINKILKNNNSTSTIKYDPRNNSHIVDVYLNGNQANHAVYVNTKRECYEALSCALEVISLIQNKD